ncbi:MAG: hypothetical protein ABI480_15095 [Chitinophagaceae bacterium]
MKKDSEITTQGNVSTTISTDIAKLAKLTNLKEFKPTHVKFKYIFIDNSGKNERLTVPGPSDSNLEAVLYFDEATFEKMRIKYFNTDYVSPGFDKNSFNFDWLDKKIKEEFLKNDINYHGDPDYVFGGSCKLWLLNDKLLLTMARN